MVPIVQEQQRRCCSVSLGEVEIRVDFFFSPFHITTLRIQLFICMNVLILFWNLHLQIWKIWTKKESGISRSRLRSWFEFSSLLPCGGTQEGSAKHTHTQGSSLRHGLFEAPISYKAPQNVNFQESFACCWITAMMGHDSVRQRTHSFK